MQSTELPAPSFPRTELFALGSLSGVIALILASGLTMAAVPRVEEGSRSVVALPWRVYAVLPGSITFGLLALWGFVVPWRRWSAFFLIGFNLAVAVCNCILVGLLSRDYIGKL